MKIKEFSGKNLQVIAISDNAVLRAGIDKMNENGIQVLAILDAKDGSFAGLLTDGDIRRSLTDGAFLDTPIQEVANSNPKVIKEPLKKAEIAATLDSMGVEFLPVVQNGKLVSFYSYVPGYPDLNVTAVIMAGGLGSRLRPMTDNCPKPMLKLGQKPILEHIIDRLIVQGVNDFVISLRYLGDQIIDYFEDGSHWNVSIRYVEETQRLGTGGALSLLPHTVTDTFICLNGDILCDLDVKAMLQHHLSNDFKATMAVYPHKYAVPYGVVQATEAGEYLGSSEKPVMSYPVNMGVYCLSKIARGMVPMNQFYDLPSLFEDLIAQGHKCGAYHHLGHWTDIGTPDEFEREQQRFQSGTHTSKR